MAWTSFRLENPAGAGQKQAAGRGGGSGGGGPAEMLDCLWLPSRLPRGAASAATKTF